MAIQSFIGKVDARSGLLLGGVKQARSSRFEDYRQAVRWIDVTIDTNLKAGRQAMNGGIEPSQLPPEVLVTSPIDTMLVGPSQTVLGLKEWIDRCNQLGKPEWAERAQAVIEDISND